MQFKRIRKIDFMTLNLIPQSASIKKAKIGKKSFNNGLKWELQFPYDEIF